MTQSTNLTRREWFRLRTTRPQQTLGETPIVANPSGREPTPSLQNIEHPPNHDGMDLSLLPPMREAILTVQQVQSLFNDIEQFASDVLLMLRHSGAQRASAAAVSTTEQLRLAQTALLSGQVPRLQIRYRWENSLWIDTLANTDEGVRLVRIAHKN